MSICSVRIFAILRDKTVKTKIKSVTLNLSSLGDNNPDARTVFVSGLDWKVGETELQEHFGIIGQVVRITILKDRYTGCSKGCAYIQVILTFLEEFYWNIWCQNVAQILSYLFGPYVPLEFSTLYEL